MKRVIDWYWDQSENHPSLEGAGGKFRNGTPEGRAMRIWINNGDNSIVVSAMRPQFEKEVTVYIFHYRE